MSRLAHRFCFLIILAFVELALAYSNGSPECFVPASPPSSFTSVMCSNPSTSGVTLAVSEATTSNTAASWSPCTEYILTATAPDGIKGILFSVATSTEAIAGLQPGTGLKSQGNCVTHDQTLDSVTEQTSVFLPTEETATEALTFGVVVLTSRSSSEGSCVWGTAEVSLPHVASNATCASSPPPPPASGVVSVTGYLTDILCYNLGVGLDGADMRRHPEDHTVHCLRDIQRCIDSGYGILTNRNEGEGEADYDLAYAFDEGGNSKSLSLVQSYPDEKEDNVLVTVTGTVADDGTLVVDSIVDEEFSGAVAAAPVVALVSAVVAAVVA